MPSSSYVRFALGCFKKRYLIFFILIIHVGLLGYAGYCDAPTEIEIAHLPSGISHWETGSYYFFRQNPPLVRLIASLPVWYLSSEMNWDSYSERVGIRPEFHLGRDFLDANGQRSFFLFSLARWVCIPFSLLGAWICYLWARDLFGYGAGLVALTLWCFCPMIIGHGHLINPDVASASLGIAAAYTLWLWFRMPTWRGMAIAGFVCGMALLTKLTWIILLMLWPILWLCWLILKRESYERKTLVQSAIQLPCLLLVALLVLNMVYGFEGSFQKLGDYEFVSQKLSGLPRIDPASVRVGNCFHGTRLENIPVPFPRYYVEGIDIQKFDFERPWFSYLGGAWKEGSWWYYYFYAAMVKTPVGILALLIFAVLCMAASCAFRSDGFNEVILLFPILAIIVLCSSQTNMGVHYRYILPAFPFVYIWISRVGVCFSMENFASYIPKCFVLTSLGVLVVSSLLVYPHSLSFFNYFSGGPENGWRYLLGSNVDWGQDALRLHDWQRQCPDSPPLKVALASYVEPKDFDIKGEIIECKLPECRKCKPSDITAGWYAISVNYLYDRKTVLSFFRKIKPQATIGHTIKIYHLSVEEAASIHDTARLVMEMKEAVNNAAMREHPIRVALLGPDELQQDSLKPLLLLVNHEDSCTCDYVVPQDLRDGALKNFDVILVPGGSAMAMSEALGIEGRRAIQHFLANGGGYVGICAGAYLATTGYGLDVVQEKPMRGTFRAPDGKELFLSDRGIGVVVVKMTQFGSEIFPGTIMGGITVDFTGGPVFAEWKKKTLSSAVSLADYHSEIWKYPSQKDTMIGTPAITAYKYGKGRIILFGPHPETTPDNDRIITQAVKAVAANLD